MCSAVSLVGADYIVSVGKDFLPPPMLMTQMTQGLCMLFLYANFEATTCSTSLKRSLVLLDMFVCIHYSSIKRLDKC